MLAVLQVSSALGRYRRREWKVRVTVILDIPSIRARAHIRLWVDLGDIAAGMADRYSPRSTQIDPR